MRDIVSFDAYAHEHGKFEMIQFTFGDARNWKPRLP
jgi:hypothetical protein